jgi:hypothetical protein
MGIFPLRKMNGLLPEGKKQYLKKGETEDTYLCRCGATGYAQMLHMKNAKNDNFETKNNK